MVMERTLISRLYQLDHLYGLLLTFGLALIIEGLFRNEFGVSGLPYAHPAAAPGRRQSRLHVPAASIAAGWWWPRSLVCLATWFVIERTRLGAYLRAATENPTLVQAFGINVPRLSRSPTASAWRWRLSPACWRRRSTPSTR